MLAPTSTSSVGSPARAIAAGVFAAASRASCAARSWSSRRRAEDMACMGAPVATKTSPPILTFFAGGPRLSLDRARRSVVGPAAFALPLSRPRGSSCDAAGAWAGASSSVSSACVDGGGGEASSSRSSSTAAGSSGLPASASS